MNRCLVLALVGVACVLSMGCNNRPEMAPVQGTVTLDGKPLPGGRVMFAPVASGEDKLVGASALGHIQKDGTFVLTTYEDGDGAVVGTHYPVVMENRQDDDRPNEGPKIGVITLRDTTFQVVAGQENVFKIELNSRASYMKDAVPEIDIDHVRKHRGK